MKRNSAAVAAVVLALILGNALAGLAAPIGYHAECTDNIDNNQDGFIDGDDPECVNYPWADGNGESPTQDPGYYQSTDGYEFYSDYVINYVPDPQLQEQLLCAIESVPEYHEEDRERASEIIAEYGINCQGQGP